MVGCVRNNFRDITKIVELMGKVHGTRFEFECYDIGHIYNLTCMLEQEVVEPTPFGQSIFGIPGDVGADPRNLMFMRETADKLFDDDHVWLVLRRSTLRRSASFPSLRWLADNDCLYAAAEMPAWRRWSCVRPS